MKFWQTISDTFQHAGIPWLFLLLALFTTIMPWNPHFTLPFILACSFIYIEEWKRLDVTSVCLLLLFVYYAYVYRSCGLCDSKFLLAHTAIGPFTFYVYGRNVMSRLQKESEVLAFWLVTIFFMCLFMWINVWLDVIIYGRLVILYRYMSLELGGWENTVTLYGLTVSLGLTGLAIFAAWKRPWVNPMAWVYLLVSLLSFFTIFHFVNRTGIVLLVASFMIVVGYRSIGNWKFVAYVLAGLLLLTLILIATGVINENLLIAYEYRSSNIEDNDAEGLGGRTVRWVDAVEKMWDFPTGWATVSTTFNEYTHNLWLDVLRMAGLVPFFSIILLTLPNIVMAFKVFFYKRNNVLVAAMTVFHAVFFLSCMVEPVTEGLPIYMFMYFMFWGMQSELLDRWNLDPTFVQDTDQ